MLEDVVLGYPNVEAMWNVMQFAKTYPTTQLEYDNETFLCYSCLPRVKMDVDTFAHCWWCHLLPTELREVNGKWVKWWLFRRIEARKGTVHGWFNKKLVVGQLI